MSRIATQYPERVYSTGEERHERRFLQREGVRKSGWWLFGLAALGLGAWAVYTLGPDLQRYLKIRRM